MEVKDPWPNRPRLLTWPCWIESHQFCNRQCPFPLLIVEGSEEAVAVAAFLPGLVHCGDAPVSLELQRSTENVATLAAARGRSDFIPGRFSQSVVLQELTSSFSA
jgi:hypothetical protein